MLDEIKKIIETNEKDELLYKKGVHSIDDQLAEKLFWSYHPFTERYFFEGNPSFTFEYKNLFDMGRFPIIMFRDGFLGILSFFQKYPKPPSDLKSFLLIPKLYSSLVPKYWGDKSALYSIHARSTIDSTYEDLFIYGLGVEETFWIHTMDEVFNKIEDIGKKYKNIHCYFPTRSSELSLPERRFKSFHHDLIKKAWQIFGDKVQLYESHEDFFKVIDKSKHCSFYNLDTENIFLADNYLDHFFLAKNAKPLISQEPVKTENRLEYNLSLNHKIIIESIEDQKSFFSMFYLLNNAEKQELSIYDLFNNHKNKELYSKIFNKKV